MLPEPFHTISQSDIRLRELPAGERIFGIGETTHAMFYLLSGEVHLQRYSENGDLIIIHRARANSYFAEASLFVPAYHCDAVATQHAVIATLSKQIILTKMNADPQFSFMVTAYFARQVQDYRRLLEIRSIKSAGERVLTGVQESLHRGNVISFAATLGLSHEATYRALSKLVKEGRIRKTGRGQYQLLR
jgi:CRP-like cAMP-binding protein